MKRKIGLILVLFFSLTLFFFYPVLKGYIPFPGDTLVNTPPYNTQSYLGYAPGGVPSKGQGSDVIHEMYPWKAFVISSLKEFQMPFWTPYNFSGNPILANFQSAVFYPLNILFLILPFNTAWTVFIFLGPFLAACFTFLFLKELKLSAVACAFGGIVFGFCSYMAVWLEYGNISQTLLWLPLALLFTEKLTKRFDRKNCLFLLLTLWLSFLAGYIQGFFYIDVTVAFYFLFKYYFLLVAQNENFFWDRTPLRSAFRHAKNSIPRLRKQDKLLHLGKIAFFFFLILAPFGLSAFQLLPTLQLFRTASRGNYALAQIHYLLNPVWYAITVLVPDFFGNPATRNYWFNGTYIERVSYFGVIPLLFAITAILSLREQKILWFFGGLFLLTFLVSLNTGITEYIYRIPIPMLSTSVPTRILVLFEFCGAVLSAFGLEFFLHKKQKLQFIFTIFISGIVLFVTWIFVLIAGKMLPKSSWTQYLTVSQHNLILPTTFFIVFLFLVLLQFYFTSLQKSLRFNLQTGIVIIFFLVVILDLFYFFEKITPFSPKAFVYPQTPVISYLQNNAGINRFWGYGSAYISSNFQTYDKTFSPEGEDPLHIRTYTELLSTSRNGKFPLILPRPDANIAKAFAIADFHNDIYRQRILDLVGIKYILYKDDLLTNQWHPHVEIFPSMSYRLIWQESPWQVYENMERVPRFFLTNRYLVVSDKRKLLKDIFDKDFDLKKTIIVTTDPQLRHTSLIKKVVQLVSYQPNKIVFSTNTNADSLLFLSDTYYPSWHASIDGKTTKIYLADYTFRAVKVPKGTHRILFYYGTETFMHGLIFSSFFAILLVLIFSIKHFIFYEK